MRRMDNYFDDHGYIVTMPDKDGTNSFHNHGMYRFARYIKFRNDKAQLARERAKYEQELDGFEDPKKQNYYRRHPEPLHWHSLSNNFTSDQQRSGVIAMGALGLKDRLCGLFFAHALRLGFYQNTRKHDEVIMSKKRLPDFAAPNHLGEYIRAFYMLGSLFKLVGILYPILIFCDIFAFIEVLSKMSKWKDPDYTDDDGIILSMIQARLALPTPISFLTRKFYLRRRSLAGFVDKEETLPIRNSLAHRDMTGPESCLYLKYKNDQSPPLYEVYIDIMKKYMRS